jgi:hypothetical protein
MRRMLSHPYADRATIVTGADPALYDLIREARDMLNDLHSEMNPNYHFGGGDIDFGGVYREIR